MKIGPKNCTGVCRCIGIEVTLTPKDPAELEAEVMRVIEGWDGKLPYTDEGAALLTEALSKVDAWSDAKVTLSPCKGKS